MRWFASNKAAFDKGRREFKTALRLEPRKLFSFESRLRISTRDLSQTVILTISLLLIADKSWRQPRESHTPAAATSPTGSPPSASNTPMTRQTSVTRRFERLHQLMNASKGRERNTRPAWPTTLPPTIHSSLDRQRYDYTRIPSIHTLDLALGMTIPSSSGADPNHPVGNRTAAA